MVSTNGDAAIKDEKKPSEGGVGMLALTIKDVSFSMPLRKKMALETTTKTAEGKGGFAIRGRNQQTGEVEFQLRREEIGTSL